jgi:transcriptional accessory protein Tex/SPT6
VGNIIKKVLDEVTIVAVTGVNVNDAQHALLRSMAGLSFGKSLLIASAPPSQGIPGLT